MNKKNAKSRSAADANVRRRNRRARTSRRARDGQRRDALRPRPAVALQHPVRHRKAGRARRPRPRPAHERLPNGVCPQTFASSPAHVGTTVTWHASFWHFIAAYCSHRFGEDWCLTPEESLLIHSGINTIPQQVIVRVRKGSNRRIQGLRRSHSSHPVGRMESAIRRARP